MEHPGVKSGMSGHIILRKVSLIIEISIKLISIKLFWSLQTTAEMDMIKSVHRWSQLADDTEERKLYLVYGRRFSNIFLTEIGLCFPKEHTHVAQDYNNIR